MIDLRQDPTGSGRDVVDVFLCPDVGRLMRFFRVELDDEGIESGLLLLHVHAH